MTTDQGSVTAETAVVLPALVLVLCAGLSVFMAVSTQLRCVDVARGAARAAARGEVLTQVRAQALLELPKGSSVSLRRNADTVRVEVHTVVHPLGALLGRIAAVPVSSVVAAPLEEAPLEQPALEPRGSATALVP